MKIPFRLLAAALLMVLLPLRAAALSPGALFSRTAVLMDADTGQVLFDKEMDRKVYPASTTKIMTGLLVSELCELDEMVTVSRSAVDIDEWNSANMSLTAGEVLSVESLLYGLMLQSANDAANALAEHVAGSQERFVELMNQRAWEMGAKDTRFVNAHGLHQDGHYTTARDMAVITREAAGNPVFMRFFGGETYTVPPSNLQPLRREFTNYQSMLVPTTGYYDPTVTGGKIGYTTEAQHTMSTIATRDGRTLICVVMYSTERTEKFYDTQRLLDYGFDAFSPVTLSASEFETGTIPAGDSEATFHSESDFTALLRNDLDLSQVTVVLPEAFTEEEVLPSAFAVVIDTEDETVPALLGMQPVTFQLAVDDVLLPPPAEDAAQPVAFWQKPQDKAFEFTPLVITALVLTGVLMILLAVVITRYRALKRRRQQRLQRLSRRMRPREYERSA